MGRITFGLLVLAAGALLLLNNMGMLPEEFTFWELVETYWPSLLIFWGLSGFVRSLLGKAKYNTLGVTSAIWPLGLAMFGAGLQAQKLGLIEVSLWGLLLPVGLILIGVFILFGKKPRVKEFAVMNVDWDKAAGGETVRTPDGLTIEKKVGDVRLSGPDWNVENTSIELKAGSVHLNLLEAKIPEGETEIRVEVKAGDCHIRLPEDVATDVVGIVRMGDCHVIGQHASGGGSLAHRSENYDEAERRLKVRAEVKFGDLHVRKV